MARAIQTSSSIIDLTGEDDSDDSIARTHAACQKAFAAASRLTSHFESMKTPKPVAYQDPNANVDLKEKNSIPTSVPQPLISPRLGAFPKPARCETDGPMKDEKDNATLRRNISIPSPHSLAPQSGLGATASKPARPLSKSERTDGKKEQPNVSTTSFTPKTDAFLDRTPRSAAISAKQNITEACSELEEWRNKDLNLIPQQASLSTPRRPGKPNDDLEEWSPGSNTKKTEEERKGLARISTNSSTPPANKDEDLTVNGGNSLSHTQGMSASLETRKRKSSGSSQSRTSPVKAPRLNEESTVHHDSDPLEKRKRIPDELGTGSRAGIFPKCVYPAIKVAKGEYKESLPEDDLARIDKSIINDIREQGVEVFCPESANCPIDQRTGLILKSVSDVFHEKALKVLNVRSRYPVNLVPSAEYSLKAVNAPDFEQDLRASPLERSPPSRNMVKINDNMSSEKSNANFRENGASAKVTTDTQEKIDPRLQPRLQTAAGPIASEAGLHPASLDLKYASLFESVVDPTLLNSKNRYNDKLSGKDLDTIGKSIKDEVLTKLISGSENPQPDKTTRKRIKHFVKKLFRQRVRRANKQLPRNSAAHEDVLRLGIAYLASGSLGLGGTTGSKPVLSESDHSSAPGLNHRENTIEETQAPQQPRPQSPYQQMSLSLQDTPNESLKSTFAPDFDRGRYPALRRRRANKYYTPPSKSSKKTSKVAKGQFVPSDHNSVPRVSNGNDQVRLSNALANQPEILRMNAAQQTALTTAAENERTPTDQRSASELFTGIDEPTDVAHVESKPASYTDVSKALRQNIAQDQGRMIDIGESSHGPFSSYFAKSQTNIAINRSTQQTLRRRLLEDTSSQKAPRPSICPTPATALDPSLEYAVAVSVTDTLRGTSQEGNRYLVTHKDRMRLVTRSSIVKHVDSTSNVEKPKLVRIETKVIDPVRRQGSRISSLIRNRELGQTAHGRHLGSIDELRQLQSETIEQWKAWKGASGDVVAVAWNPDSNVYAFGAAALTNIEDIQYNRPCNLLLGNLTSNTLRELPDHRVDRPKPATIPNGPNSTQAVYDACDPNVYETVTSIAFSSTGDRMFTASHDCTVKIWDVATEKPQCQSTLRHEAWVTSVEISEHQPGLFATATKSVKNAIRIYQNPSCYVNFSASRAESKPEWKIYPECLRWGPNPYTSHLLLAGFQQWEQHGDLVSGGGQLCLWDAHAFESIKVTPSSQSIYAAAWHPTQLFFATGGAPGNNVTDKINTKSVVRTWDVRTPKRCQVEYECPAKDMQDITFSPLNPNIVTAGCTDGSSYVWDWRWPDELLHHLKHGRPLWELDHTKEREEADTGVMLSVWGPGGTLFYTGSSDGVIKAWDVRRHPKDVLSSNVANLDVSIISGAFSPDGSNLLVGDAEGGVYVLSSAPCGPRSNVKSTDAYIDLVRASDGSGVKVPDDENPGTEGIEAARSLVESGQLEYHKELGVGQGLNYQGPYASHARKEVNESTFGRLRKKFEKRQPISKRGEKRWDIAIPMTSLLCERKETLDREKGSDRMKPGGIDERALKTTQPSKGGETVATSPSSEKPNREIAAGHPAALEGISTGAAGVEESQRDEDNTIPEHEMIEENYWWVRMGEEEVDRARAR